MKSPNAGIGGRTQQAGTLVAATVMPITFQPTLMPRSGLDQALITGVSTSLNYAFAALIQDSIEAVALRGAGRTDPAKVDRHTWRRASIGLDLAAIGAGLAAPERPAAEAGRAAAARRGADGRLVAVGHRPVRRGHRRAPGADRPPRRHPGPLAPGGAVRRRRPGRGQRLPAPALGGAVPRGDDRRGRTRVGGQVVRHEPWRDRRAHRAGRRRAPVRPGRGERAGARPARPRAGLPAPRPPGRPLGPRGRPLRAAAQGRPPDRAGGRADRGGLRPGAHLPARQRRARGARWPGRRSAARAAATWPPRCDRRRSSRSWANRRWPSPSGCSSGWRAPPPRPSGSPWPWPSWSAPAPSTGSC